MVDVTLLIGTCDRYSTLWDNSTLLINRYWQVDCKKVFAGETKKIEHSGFDTILCGKDHWTNIIRRSLDSIDTEYVFFMVEYFFMTSTYSQKMLDNGISFLKANDDANKLLYVEELSYYIFDSHDEPYLKMNDESGYLTSVHPALWKTSYLKACLDLIPNKNPWQFEIDGGDLVKGKNNKIYVKHLTKQMYLNVIVNGEYNRKWDDLRIKEKLIDTKISNYIKPDVSLVITSCDKYSFLWDNLATQTYKYWHVNCNKYIISETLQFKHKEFYTCFAGKMNWTDMLIDGLKGINTEYVFLHMDDFLFKRKIDDEFILDSIKFLRDNNANKLVFSGASTYYKLQHINGDLFKFEDDSDYLTTLQPALWRTSYLKECLVSGMNPWQFEIDGTNRMKGKNNKVYLKNMGDISFNVVVKGQIDPHWIFFKQMEGLTDI